MAQVTLKILPDSMHKVVNNGAYIYLYDVVHIYYVCACVYACVFTCV